MPTRLSSGFWKDFHCSPLPHAAPTTPQFSLPAHCTFFCLCLPATQACLDGVCVLWRTYLVSRFPMPMLCDLMVSHSLISQDSLVVSTPFWNTPPLPFLIETNVLTTHTHAWLLYSFCLCHSTSHHYACMPCVVFGVRSALLGHCMQPAHPTFCTLYGPGHPLEQGRGKKRTKTA